MSKLCVAIYKNTYETKDWTRTSKSKQTRDWHNLFVAVTGLIYLVNYHMGIEKNMFVKFESLLQPAIVLSGVRYLRSKWSYGIKVGYNRFLKKPSLTVC